MNDIIVDDVARAMTDVEAPANLRARVLSRIDRPQPRRWPACLIPLGAAASMAAAAVLGIRPLLTLDAPIVPRPSFVQPIAGVPAPRIVAFERLAASGQRAEAPMSADELAWLSRRLPALETPPLTLEPIQPAAPSIAPISVEPIALEPISVPPPGAGSGDHR